jgi:deoxycytidine triphosphate deaminase
VPENPQVFWAIEQEPQPRPDSVQLARAVGRLLVLGRGTLMILVDSDIRRLCQGGNPLVTPFEPARLQNCRYNLTAGKAFLPECGNLQELNVSNDAGQRRLHWTIEPTETLVFQTRERVRIPGNLMGQYGQLNRLANIGLNLINESIIEPGYDGYLSCFLVNLSKRPVRVNPEDESAKITFHELREMPADLKTLRIEEAEYSQGLSEAASIYPRSFLDIESLQSKISNATTDSVKKSITFGGVLLALLLAWSSAEPIISRLLWEHTGTVLDTSSAEVQRLRDEVDQLQKQQQESANVAALQKQLNALTQRLDRLPGQK